MKKTKCQQQEEWLKPKLPRKRKKKAIKAQGRKWYHDTIKLFKIVSKGKMFYEPVCKFWVNSSIKQGVQCSGESIKLTPTATEYW